MEIRDPNSGQFVRLEPVGYQFPDLVGDEFDDNWLMIRGRARSGDEEWTFQDPALLVREAHEIGDWMRSASAGTATPLVPDAEGLTFPATHTIEPNIGMGLVSYEGDALTVRVFLWLESAPPSTWHGRGKTDTEFFLDITTARDAIGRAAAEWDAELARFPQRGSRSRL